MITNINKKNLRSLVVLWNRYCDDKCNREDHSDRLIEFLMNLSFGENTVAEFHYMLTSDMADKDLKIINIDEFVNTWLSVISREG
jgi:hypothetical protein